ENRIKLHFKRSYSGPLPLALFDLGKILFAVATQAAQFVQFRIDTTLNYTAVTQRYRGFLDNGLLDANAQIAQFIHRRVESHKPECKQPAHRYTHGRDSSQGGCQGQYIAWIGRL